MPPPCAPEPSVPPSPLGKQISNIKFDSILFWPTKLRFRVWHSQLSLFAIFINDLASELKDSNIGVILEEGLLINILLYADDIVLLAETEEDLQSMLFMVECWCKRWRLEVNLSKTNVMHFRKKRKKQSNFTFLFDKKIVQYCSSYRYLGANINEYLDFSFTAKCQADAAGRALGSIITKMIKNQGLPFNVYSILYSSCVTSISDYASEVTGFTQYD